MLQLLRRLNGRSGLTENLDVEDSWQTVGRVTWEEPGPSQETVAALLDLLELQVPQMQVQPWYPSPWELTRQDG